MAASTHPSILIVEDSPEDLELIVRNLRKHRFVNEIHTVPDGVAALELLAGLKQLPSLILLDLHLPRMDGFEFLKQIKFDDRTKKIPVVVLTVSKNDPDFDRCHDLGANSCIQKPVEFEKFSEVVAQLGFYWLVLNR